MAKIVPFRGLYFNQRKVSDLSRVIAPPYDAMTAKLQDLFCGRSPYNVAHLVRRNQADAEEEVPGRYGRAARQFQEWQKNHLLLREKKSVLYLCEQAYEGQEGEEAVRCGFMALARLEDFASGVVKPHEATVTEATADRFHLIKACSANFNPVISLYSDPCSVLNGLSRDIRQEPADIAATDDEGVETRIWKVADPSMIAKIQALLHDKPLFIADGHHRYETALAYRDFMRAKYPDYTGKEVFNYVMMFFANMEQPGIRIDPIHRGVTLPGSFDFDAFLDRLHSFFTVEVRQFDSGSEADRRRILAELADRGQKERVLALFAGDDRIFFLTLVDESVMEEFFASGTSRALRCLDVSILHKLVLQRLLGLSGEGGEKDSKIHFVTEAKTCFDGVKEGDFSLAFLLNPANLKEVREIANAGEKMPRMSTLFYPKIMSGLVINPIIDRETVDGQA
ncbi:MAG: DUF1015 domain-containing protein [Desulfuromonadales bacterium]